MRAQQFINEAAVTPYKYEQLSINSAVELMNKYCNQSVAMISNPLWRGMKNHSDEIFTLWPETGMRKSQNTTNHYTVIMANSPYMRGWPRRDKSIICSSSATYASSYTAYASTPYVIFPYDNVEIAVCPREDMWDTSINIPLLRKKFRPDDMNSFLENYDISDVYEEMIQQLNTPTTTQYKTIAKKFNINPPELVPAIAMALSPERAGFTLMSIQEFAANPPRNKECWVGGPCIAMSESLWERFRQSVVNRNAKNAGN